MHNLQKFSTLKSYLFNFLHINNFSKIKSFPKIKIAATMRHQKVV